MSFKKLEKIEVFFLDTQCLHEIIIDDEILSELAPLVLQVMGYFLKQTDDALMLCGEIEEKIINEPTKRFEATHVMVIPNKAIIKITPLCEGEKE